MIKKILIYQDLIARIPELYGVLNQHAEVTIVTDGRDALDKIRRLKPDKALLSQQMAQLSGVDVAKYAHELPSKIAVVVVGQRWSEEHIEASGSCQLCLLTDGPGLQHDLAEQVLPDLQVSMVSFHNLLASRSGQSKEEHRGGERQSARGSAHLVLADRELLVEVQNIAKSGLLLVSKESVPLQSEAEIVLHAPSGQSITTQVRIVRSQPLQRHGFGLGAQFSKPDAALMSVVEAWVQHSQQLRKHNIKVGAAVQDTEEEQVRKAHRVAVEQPVGLAVIDHPKLGDQLLVHYGSAQHEGQLINISRSGVLIGLKTVFPNDTQVQVSFSLSPSEQVQVTGVVVRSVKLKEPINDFIYGMGARFVGLSEADENRLELWVQRTLQVRQEVPVPDSRFVESVLSLSWDKFKLLVVQDANDDRLRYGNFKTAFELSALTQQQDYSDCVRDLLMAKVKLGLFQDFIPALKDLPDDRIRFFVSLARQSMKLGEAAEQLIDGLVKAAVDQGDEAMRSNLNEVSNKFFEVKVQVAFAVADQFIDTDLGENFEPLVEIIDFSKQQKEFQAYRQDQIKYQKRKAKQALTAPTPAHGSRSYKLVGLTFVVFVLVVAGWGIHAFVLGRLSVGQLPLAVPVEKIARTEFGLDVYITRQSWSNLSLELRQESLDKVEQLLAEKNIRQAKVLDEASRMLAVTAVVQYRVGEKPIFSRRIYD